MGETINIDNKEETINITVGTDTINIEVGAVSVMNAYVDEDVAFRLDGADGDTYLKKNSTTGLVELYVDGVKQAEWGSISGSGDPFA